MSSTPHPTLAQRKAIAARQEREYAALDHAADREVRKALATARAAARKRERLLKHARAL